MPRHCLIMSMSVVTVLGTLTALPRTSRAAALLPARNLLVLPQSETEASMALLWDKPVVHDNVAGYVVYQNGALVATTAAGKTFYGATHLAPDKSYSFYVVAKDAGGNCSAPSATVTASTRPAGMVIDVTAAAYHAKGDGTTKNTAAIQKAIEACPAGGTVQIPAGTFLTGPLVLKGDMSFYITHRLHEASRENRLLLPLD